MRYAAWALSLRETGAGRRFRPRPAKAREFMDLTVTRAQYDAVRGARHLPDVLRKVLDAATRRGDEYLLRLTYEEATALNELCAWNGYAAPRRGPHLARGGGPGAGAGSHGGAGLGPTAALGARRQVARLRRHAPERPAALAAADRRGRSAPGARPGRRRVRSRVAARRQGTAGHERHQMAPRAGDRAPQRRVPDRGADLDRSPVAPLGRLARRQTAAPVPRHARR